LLVAACGGPPGPSGWAPAQPVQITQQDLVLVPYRNDLYALQDGSTNLVWQFPPREKENYPLSDARKAVLRASVEDFDVDQDARDRLDTRIDDLFIQGPSIDGMKDEIDASGHPNDEILNEQRGELKDAVDEFTRFERNAIDDLKALYGNIAVDDDATTAYVPGFGGWIYALDVATSRARWILDVRHEMVGGIAWDGGTLYFGTKGQRVYAVDAETGVEQWNHEVDGEVWATPTVAGGAVFVPTFGGSVYRLNAESGDEEWRFGGAGSGIAARPTVDDGTVYIGAFDDRLYALDAATGDMRWSIEARNWFWAQAVVTNDTVYAASLDGKVYAVDAGSGERRWEPFAAGAEIRSSPTVAGDALIVAGRDGRVHKIDLDSGERTGAPADLTARIDADLAAVDDAVYVVPRNRTLFVIDAGGDLASQSFPLP
jgi:outer membrane protein assembly factor BamB